jgi:hypothetical protein
MTRIESSAWRKFKREDKRRRAQRSGPRYDRIWAPTLVLILVGGFFMVVGMFKTRPIHWVSQRRMATEAATQDEMLLHQVKQDVWKITQAMITSR